MPQKKSTKKFEKRHLQGVLERRKKVAKVKQRKQLQDKKKKTRARDNDAAGAEGTAGDKGAKGDTFKNMSVDEFFAGGFDVPEGLKTKAERSRAKDVAPTTGKRKRPAPEEEDEDEVGSGTSDSEPAEQALPDDPPSEDESADDGDELHQDQLDALALKDPEFYKYMKENEPELLDFDAKNFAELAALSDDESPKKRRKANEDSGDEMAISGVPVTLAMVEKWRQAMSELHSLRATRETVLAFTAAVSLNDDKEYKYAISNADVYNGLLQIALKQVPEVLQHHVPVKESKSGKVHLPTETSKFKTLSPMIRSYISSVQRLLENLSDSATQSLTLTSMLPLIPYVLPFRKTMKVFCRIVVDVWSDKGSTEATRIAAFLVMRRLVVVGDAGIRETVLRATYQGLVKGSRNTTAHNVQDINLMKNSAVELWGFDPAVGYTTGFTFIRQLAIHLRTSITNSTKESYKQVYNWQYIHSLDFWSRVLSQHCNSLKEAELGRESPLRPLIYPTVQVTLGAMRLIPTAQYYPLRFQLIRALLRISHATGSFIPVGPSLYEVLNSREMKKPPKASTIKALDFSTCIRAPKTYLRTRTYQDGVGEEVAELMCEFLALWAKSIAFPELALTVSVMLRRWHKVVSSRSTGNRNDKVNNLIRLVIQKVEANSLWIQERRATVHFAPNDRAGVEAFLRDEPWERTPLGAFVVTQRFQRQEKQKLLEKARDEHEARRLERMDDGDDDAPFDGIANGNGSDVDGEDDDDDDDEFEGGGGEEWTVRAAD